MFDFKYHIVSLVAVFLALGIGVVMGSMTAERGVISEQEKALIATMQKDFEKLRDENTTLTATVTADTRFAESVAPLLVTDKLKGMNVAVVVTGSIDTPDLKNLKAMFEKAGAVETSVTTFTGGKGLTGKNAVKQLDDAAVWIAGGANSKELTDLAATGFMETSGSYDLPVQGIIIISGTENDKGPKFDSLDAPLVKTFQTLPLILVSGESSTVKNSAVKSFKGLGVSTVDNIDTTPGLISIVYILGGQPGNFGAKSTADSLMPVPATN